MDGQNTTWTFFTALHTPNIVCFHFKGTFHNLPEHKTILAHSTINSLEFISLPEKPNFWSGLQFKMATKCFHYSYKPFFFQALAKLVTK